MKLYSDIPARRAVQVAADVGVVLWVVLWVRVAQRVHDATMALAEPGRRPRRRRRSFRDTMTSAGDDVDDLPLARRPGGHAVPVRRPGSGTEIEQAGTDLGDRASSGSRSARPRRRRSCRSSSSVVVWLVLRLRFVRRAGAAQRFIDAAPGPRPVRAAGHGQPADAARWRRISDDPAGAWRRGEPRRHPRPGPARAQGAGAAPAARPAPARERSAGVDDRVGRSGRCVPAQVTRQAVRGVGVDLVAGADVLDLVAVAPRRPGTRRTGCRAGRRSGSACRTSPRSARPRTGCRAPQRRVATRREASRLSSSTTATSTAAGVERLAVRPRLATSRCTRPGQRRSRCRRRGRSCGRRWRASRSGRPSTPSPTTRTRRAGSRRPCRCSSRGRGRCCRSATSTPGACSMPGAR